MRFLSVLTVSPFGEIVSTLNGETEKPERKNK